MWTMRGIFDRDRPDLALSDMMLMMGQNFIDEEKQTYKKVLEEKSKPVKFNLIDEYTCYLQDEENFEENGLDEEEYECDQYYC